LLLFSLLELFELSVKLLSAELSELLLEELLLTLLSSDDELSYDDELSELELSELSELFEFELVLSDIELGLLKLSE
jgi:hypothetical protein